MNDRKKQHRRYALKCELLEDRRLLAAFTVNSLGDSHDAQPGDGFALDASGETTFRAAVEESNALGTDNSVDFAVSGTVNLDLGEVLVVDDLTVDGGGITIRGNSIERVMAINDRFGSSTVELHNMTITNGRAEFGGGIYNAETTLLSNVTITGNIAQPPGPGGVAYGGGIFNRGQLEIRDSNVYGNTVDADDSNNAFGGGVASAGRGASLTVTNSTVTDNSAGASGGGVFVQQSVLSIVGSQISDNQAGAPDTLVAAGGGIAVTSRSPSRDEDFGVTIRSSTISGNHLANGSSPLAGFAYGGGMYAGGTGNILITDSVVNDNTAFASAFNRGGAADFRGIAAGESDGSLNVDIERSVVTQNFSHSGGALSITGHESSAVTVNVTTSEVTSNSGYYGGAFNVWAKQSSTPGKSVLHVIDSTITGNVAFNGGASSASYGGEAHFTRSSINYNTAFEYGGAIYSRGINLCCYLPPKVSITDSTLADNYAAYFGGGAVASYNSELTVTQSTFSDNFTTYSGGAIQARTYGAYWGAGYPINTTIERSTITGNQAFGGGGGLAINYFHDATLTNSIVSGNSSYWGADIWDRSSPYLAQQTRYSLIGTNDGTLFEASVLDADGNKIGSEAEPISAGLAPLSDNGGPTATHLPLPGSLAIDMADPLAVGTNDQRGQARIVGGRMDIGAVEAALACDFDADGVCDILDIDTLVMEIAGGMADLAFDLNADAQVDLLDVEVWLAMAGALNLPIGNAFLFGDGDLDGVVDVSDFGIWNSNKFTATGKWSQADFNADGVTDVSDFTIWNANKFSSSFFAIASEQGRSVEKLRDATDLLASDGLDEPVDDFIAESEQTAASRSAIKVRHERIGHRSTAVSPAYVDDIEQLLFDPFFKLRTSL